MKRASLQDMKSMKFQKIISRENAKRHFECREQLAQLSVHADIASKLNRLIDEKVLVEMGKLEQDLVYGNATSKEVVTFLNYHRNLGTEEKASFTLPPKESPAICHAHEALINNVMAQLPLSMSCSLGISASAQRCHPDPSQHVTLVTEQ